MKENAVAVVSRQEQVREALKRLDLLQSQGLHENVRREFERDGTVNYSERRTFLGQQVGVLFWLDNEPEWAARAREVENEFGCVVYHATAERLSMAGRCLTMHAVSGHPEEWDDDMDDLSQGQALAYVANLDDDEMSKWGYVGIRVSGGGLVRTW